MPAAAMGAIAVGGAIIGSQSQKSAAKKAANATKYAADQSAQVQRDLYNQTRSDLEPYRNAGYQGLSSLTGQPVTMQAPAPTMRTMTVPQNTTTPASAPQGPTPSHGGANALSQVNSTSNKMPGFVDAHEYFTGQGQNSDPSATVESSNQMVDKVYSGKPVGDLSVPEFSFELDPTDEIYKWKQEKAEEAINRAAAARGHFDSSKTMNALANANMALAADEADSQYNRALQKYGLDYGRATDLYNSKYTNALNLANMGMGVAGQLANTGTNTANALSNIYQTQGESAAGAALARGQSNAQMWNTIGNAPMNAFALYNAYKSPDYANKYSGASYNAMVI